MPATDKVMTAGIRFKSPATGFGSGMLYEFGSTINHGEP
jgi:hypothetical protein